MSGGVILLVLSSSLLRLALAVETAITEARVGSCSDVLLWLWLLEELLMLLLLDVLVRRKEVGLRSLLFRSGRLRVELSTLKVVNICSVKNLISMHSNHKK